ncbi:microtubule-associated protein futsch [Culicoides brevitarsis]|uniref:microtubule-associated protein futsch n=1 Tax=Culicoides brevitarsis TaxID=469753 RepID=UPI00307C08EC
MENTENASQNATQKQVPQQQMPAGVSNAETSVKKLIPLKGLKKINPALLKNVKDAMISAVAKSKIVNSDAKTTTTSKTQEIVHQKPPKKDVKVKILSVENPQLNVKDLFPNLTLPEAPKVQNSEGTASKSEMAKVSKPIRSGASDAVKLALAKKLANKKLVAAAIKNKSTRNVKPPPKDPPVVVEPSSDMEIDQTITSVMDVPSTSGHIVYATESLTPLTPSKIDISSLPVIIDDGTLAPLIVVPPAENFQQQNFVVSTPSSVKRKISFSNESDSEVILKSPAKNREVSVAIKQPGVVQLDPPVKFHQKIASPVKIEKKSEAIDLGEYTVHRGGNPTIRSPSSNIRVPFEIHGDTKRRICLTKITTSDPQLKQNVLQGCRKLVKSTSTPFVKIKDERDSDDELHGFTSAEIEASKRMMESRLGYLKRNSEGSSEKNKSTEEPKVKPKVVANIKSMLKNSSLQEKLKQAVEANRKNMVELTKEPDKVTEKSQKKTKQTEIKNWLVKKATEVQKSEEKSIKEALTPVKIVSNKSSPKVIPVVNSSIEEAKVIKRPIERSRKQSEVCESPLKSSTEDIKISNKSVERSRKGLKTDESPLRVEKSFSEELKAIDETVGRSRKHSETLGSPRKRENSVSEEIKVSQKHVERIRTPSKSTESPSKSQNLVPESVERSRKSSKTSESPSKCEKLSNEISSRSRKNSEKIDESSKSRKKSISEVISEAKSDKSPLKSPEKVTNEVQIDSTPQSPNVKSSLLDIREKLSQSLGSISSASSSNPEISSILELLKQDSLLNDFVKFAKEKMVKTGSSEVENVESSEKEKSKIDQNIASPSKNQKKSHENVKRTKSVSEEIKSPVHEKLKSPEKVQEKPKEIESDDDSRGFDDNFCSRPESPVDRTEETKVDKVDLPSSKKTDDNEAKKSKEISHVTSPIKVPTPVEPEIKSPKKGLVENIVLESQKSEETSTKTVIGSQRSLSINRNSLPKTLKPKKKFTPLIPKARMKGILSKTVNKDAKVAESDKEPVKTSEILNPEIEDLSENSILVENSTENPSIEEGKKSSEENKELKAHETSEKSVSQRRRSSLKSPTKEAEVVCDEKRRKSSTSEQKILLEKPKSDLKSSETPKKQQTKELLEDKILENGTNLPETVVDEPKNDQKLEDLNSKRHKSKSTDPIKELSSKNSTENEPETSPVVPERRKSRLLTLPEANISSNVTDFDSSMAEFMAENVVTEKKMPEKELKIVDEPPVVEQIEPEKSKEVIEIDLPKEIPSEKPELTEKLEETAQNEEVETPKIPETPVSKRRGRPKKSTPMETSTPKAGKSSEPEFPVEFGLLRRKAATQADQKRRSKSSNEIPSTPLPSEPEIKEESTPTDTPKSRRGRKRKNESTPKTIPAEENNSDDDDEEPLSALSKGKRKIDTSTPAPAPKKHKADTDYTCSACNQFIERKKWLKHLIQHNGLAWRIELDPPIDIENENVKLNTMIRFQKERRIPVLTCEKCGEQKKSALGLIGHLKKCGLAPEELDKVKIKCEHCGSLCMSYSMPIHLRNHCRVLKEREAEERQKMLAETAPVVNEEPEFNDSGRVKRRAVKKAEALLKGESNLDFNPDQFIIGKKKHKINVRTINKWQKILEEGDLIGCYHNADCQVKSKSIEEATQHQETCEFANLIYCAACCFRSNSRNEVFEHVKANHGPGDERKFFEDEDSDAYEAKSDNAESESDISEGEDESDIDTPTENDGSDVENTRKANKRRRIEDQRHLARSNDVGMNPKYQMLRYMTFKELSQFKSAADLLIEFYKENYSLDGLYPELKPKQIKILAAKEKIAYEPIIRSSMKYFIQTASKYSPDPIAIKVENDQWKSLSLYESSTTDSSILFVGGSVTSMQWLPFPDSYNGPQILVVTSKRDPNSFMSYAKAAPETSFIQLWSFEKSSRTKTNAKIGENVSHLYSIAIDDGPIWDLKVCPSGGYVENERLGLISCTSISGKVFLYALPSLENIKNGKSDGTMIKLEPNLILDSGITAENVFGCKIAWSRQKNHSLLAAGFSNGVIAMWKLDTNSSLLRRKSSNGLILSPIQTFVAHQEAVTCLCFHHSSNGDYLLSGSQDRRLKVFQLNNDTEPLEIFILKCPSRVSCADWPVNWIAFFYGSDSEFSYQRSELKLKNPNELGPLLDYGSMCNISSTITDVAVNEWNDVIYYGSVAGEVLGCYRPNYLLTTGTEKTIERYVYSFTQLCPISKSTEQGIVFSDLSNKSSIVEKKTVCQNTRKEDISRLPCEKVSKIIINPNKSYSKYYAVGYESGFVRIKKNSADDK